MPIYGIAELFEKLFVHKPEAVNFRMKYVELKPIASKIPA